MGPKEERRVHRTLEPRSRPRDVSKKRIGACPLKLNNPSTVAGPEGICGDNGSRGAGTGGGARSGSPPMIRRNRPQGRGQGRREANVERQLGRGRNTTRTAEAGGVGVVVLRRGVVFCSKGGIWVKLSLLQLRSRTEGSSKRSANGRGRRSKGGVARTERPARARDHVTTLHATCPVAARSRVRCEAGTWLTRARAKSRDTSQLREDQLISRLRTAYLAPSRVFLRFNRPPPEEEEPLRRSSRVRGGMSTETRKDL